MSVSLQKGQKVELKKESGGALTSYLTNILTNYNTAKNITATSEKDLALLIRLSV